MSHNLKMATLQYRGHTTSMISHVVYCSKNHRTKLQITDSINRSRDYNYNNYVIINLQTIVAAVDNSTVGAAADVCAEEWIYTDNGVDPFFMQTTMAQQSCDQKCIALGLGALDPIDFSWEGY